MDALRRIVQAVRAVFNAAQSVLSLATAYLLFFGLSGADAPPGTRIVLDHPLAVWCAPIGFYLVNTMLVSAAIAFHDRASVLTSWLSHYGTSWFFLTSLVLFLVAKAVATALVARLFVLTQPKLMAIGWFAWGYERIMPWKEHLTDMVRASYVWRMGRVTKERALRAARPLWLAFKPHALSLAQASIAAARQMAARVRAMLHNARAGRSKSL